MQNQQQHNSTRFSLATIAIALIASAIASGCQGDDTQTTSSPPPKTSPTPTETTQPPETPTTQEPVASAPNKPEDAKEQTLEIYWFDAQSSDIEIVSSTVDIEVKTDSSPEAILENAMQQLLAGPQSDRHATTIPEGTKLRNVTLKSDGVHVNLSEEFSLGGGTASMTGRVAQILYTATSLNPDGKVWLEMEGEPIEVLGGEGLLLDQPLTRQSFEADFDL
ncbi:MULTISPECIES: GerMN domain-containing protein [Spirulina sp. CCY15215]|uniref:GerMN domain-containing protein n=1 Tax=Spirulina sp. CCY15215 TaxID=2767591 RepID=UPI0019517A75|nr:GerMN domain-containing protein [Spirulina major]